MGIVALIDSNEE